MSKPAGLSLLLVYFTSNGDTFRSTEPNYLIKQQKPSSSSHPRCMSSCILMTRVFVYGTLKKGQPNNYRLFDSSNGKAEFLASACTTQKYPLVIATKHNIPFLLNLPGQGNRVRGEIYKVDDKMLDFLDDFESCPTMYQRTPLKLEVEKWVGEIEGEEKPTVGSITEAFVYSTKTYQPDWPTLPCYGNYDSYGDHGLEYETRESRERCSRVE